MGKPPGAADSFAGIHHQPPLRTVHLQSVGGRGRADAGETVLQERPGGVVLELQRGGHVLAGNCSGTARACQYVLRPDSVPVRRSNAGHAADVTAEAQHVVEHVGADVEQAVAAVVALAAAVDVAHLADTSGGVRLSDGLHVRTHPALLMDGDAHALFVRLGDDLIGLGEVLAEGFLDFDIGAVLQHAHRQGVVELDADRDSDNIRLHRLHHRIEIAVAR